jgi:hypothetical protein
MAMQLNVDRIVYITPKGQRYEGSATMRQWIHWRRIKVGQKITMDTPDGPQSIIIGDAAVHSQPADDMAIGWDDYPLIDARITEVQELY